MTLKNAQNIYDDYVGSSIEDYYNFMEKNDDFIKEFKEEIENEEQELNAKNTQADIIEEKSQEMLSDVDSMLKEISELKSKINEFKLANKIKTKRDYLKYMNLVNVLTDGNNEEKNEKNEMAKSQYMFHNKMEKDFKINKNDEIQKLSEYKKFIIPKENEKDKDYHDIKEKLQKQEKQIKQIEKDKINIKDNENINKDIIQNINDVMNGDIRENADDDVNVVEGISTGDEDVDKLLKEIKMVDLQMDSYLKDIDECIEMNENIEKHLVNNDYEEEQK
jgi:hypothetical protein